MIQTCKRRFPNPFSSKILVASALVLVLSLSACGGSDEETTSGDVSTTAPEAEAAGDASTSTDASTTVTDTASASGAGAAAESADTAAAGMVTIASIDSVESISSYRMRISINGIEGKQASVEGEFVKEPPAQRLVVDMPGSMPPSLESVMVGGTRYTKVRNRWIQTPGNRFDMGETIPFTPDLVTGDLENAEELGSETVNGRATTHYRVNKDSLPDIPISRNGEERDLSTLGSVQLDLWVDQAEQFVVKMQATVENVESATPIEMLYEYYDFNAPITIEVPN